MEKALVPEQLEQLSLGGPGLCRWTSRCQDLWPYWLFLWIAYYDWTIFHPPIGPLAQWIQRALKLLPDFLIVISFPFDTLKQPLLSFWGFHACDFEDVITQLAQPGSSDKPGVNIFINFFQSCIDQRLHRIHRIIPQTSHSWNQKGGQLRLLISKDYLSKPHYFPPHIPGYSYITSFRITFVTVKVILVLL